MVDILKWFAGFLPRDSNNSAGYGPFRLPSDCEWMQRAAELHDYDYDNGPKEGKRLSEVDRDLFKRWSLGALAAEDPIEQCHRILSICAYWPLARKAGHYLYNRGQ